jgi:DNA-binding transcriptional ArsR family regulator
MIPNVIWTRSMKPFEAEAHLLKLLAHPARLGILNELRQGEACVCHLEAVLGYRQAYVSQQIMVLREAGVLQDRREGWNIFYRVAKPEIYPVVDAVSQLMGSDEKTRRTTRTPKTTCQCPKCNPTKPPTAC